MTGDNAPLAGIRVLDIATFIAAPFCGAILGEFGAEVIKIEKPGEGDPLRRLGTPTDAGDTLTWLSEARNKKSITLDLRKPEGARIFKRLVQDTDVVLENFRPGTLERWGIGFEALQKINPEIILLRISAYGQTGPKRDLPGFARIAHGFGGLSHLVGLPDGPPLSPGSTTLADYLSGAYGAIGVLLSLRAKDRSGVGQYIDIGLYEPLFRILDELLPAYTETGYVRQRMGAETFNAVPHSHYPTRDGKWVAIACTSDKMFARLCDVMGQPELAREDRYGTIAARLEARDAVNSVVANWTSGLRREDLLSICGAGDVPCGPIYSIDEIVEDPQFQARENMVRLPHPQIGGLTVPGVLPRLSETPGSLSQLGPRLGEHNAEIYGTRLGIGEHEQSRLRKAGVI